MARRHKKSGCPLKGNRSVSKRKREGNLMLTHLDRIRRS